MKYTRLPSAVFTKHRQRFMAKLKPNSIAVFNSNDIYPISADSTLPFEQHRDLFYLTGIDQEETILILCPDAKDPKQREMVFVRETNAHIAVWEGHKLTKNEATTVTGIDNVQWTTDFEVSFLELAKQAQNIYINTNEHYRAKVETQTREDRFIEWCKQQFPKKNYEKSNVILQGLRSIKDPEEITHIQQACDITEKGFRRILGFVSPGVWEFEIEAEFSHEFLSNRSKGFAYTPIIASGANSNVLHYIENSQQCQAGELILMDVGAEYGNYASDMTRTIPVSGQFTPRQRAVYKAVLKVKDEATKLLIPGVLWKDYHVEVGKLMNSALVDINLLTKKEISDNAEAYKKYFMHGTSHHLGLDTHDYGLLDEPMQANMVFTVEPGIYIPDEGFGIRLEDDVVVQATGAPVNLMANIPIDPDEIEALMNV
ncbi:MAG: aminopeptidase P family protein [Flavobacteriaceae bacterium]|jgi:Xaa-Pro aminopeptidase|nr:aminopeptidase P family protein [Flavobacteriaceae bacterium]